MQWQDNIEAAYQRIAGRIVQTPVLQSAAFGRDIALKLEQMQHTGSFKTRGAFNTLLAEDVPEAGVVAASGGNHGAAVAFAARQLGHRARIFVPEMAGPSKIALIERTGAELTVVPGEYANALELAQREAAEGGAMQIHAYDAPLTVAGQGTVMLEWERQGLDADTVLIAVGGGGLIGGALAWLGGRRKIVAVEPMTSCALNEALEKGAPVDVPVSGVAANALGARRIGQICFDLAKDAHVESVLVSDGAIIQAQQALWQAHRQLVEPAGATALAALMSGAYVPDPQERVAVLVCGGNIAPDPQIA
ncbi:threonine/serine dehydratase [Marivita sp. XM-24bin2]|jgi:threonine dehydratase|uniref:threonine/serine dehydratase n=1 Tax=unclassified Marivita TaxID=2632480 RepID=UPI000D7AE1A5|nr:threonine/serine dehydratase [Marivita sp. XM-24bin2]MCR9108330.1 threonine/serine dehydratase [Paracoccaceae bacterium]PWL36287.1 MAG: threonine dehydratase [Marivita sp. XM-24bin2]